MPARDQQRDRRVLQRLRVSVEEVCRDVAHEVVDGIERLVERNGERLRGADADHERPREPRTRGDGDGIDVAELDLRLGERRFDRRLQRLEVCARGDLGDYSAIAGVFVHARGDRVREQCAPAHDADAGLVAAGLDPEDERFGGAHVHTPPDATAVGSFPAASRRAASHPTRSSCMMIASTSSGW